MVTTRRFGPTPRLCARAQKNIEEKDLSDAELGAVKPGVKMQALRNQTHWAIVAMCIGDIEAPRVIRRVARNYL